jgi:hypothetical protein
MFSSIVVKECGEQAWWRLSADEAWDESERRD